MVTLYGIGKYHFIENHNLHCNDTCVEERERLCKVEMYFYFYEYSHINHSSSKTEGLV